MASPVVLGSPLLTDEQTRYRVEEILSKAEAEAQSLGHKLERRDRDSLLAYFFVSEEYIGAITPPAVAGWMHRNLKILPKVGGLVPFLVNPIQWRLLVLFCDALAQNKMLRYVILKARQFGISTFMEAFFFFLLLRHSGRNALAIAHKDDTTGNLYEMFRRFYDYLPFKPRTATMSRQAGIVFDRPHDSRLTLESAEGKEPKRGFTMHYLHCSEPAFWSNADSTDLGLMQVAPDEPGSIVVKESTANGVGNLFYRQYQAAKEGKSTYTALFFPWHEHPEYTIELPVSVEKDLMESLDDEEKLGAEKFGWTPGQIAWRRRTIEDKCAGSVSRFHQEYPSNDREAFLVSGRPVFDLGLLEARSAMANASRVVFQGSLVYDGDGT